MSELWRDLRFGFRILLRRPGFTLAAVLSLVLGIGINTAMFTVIDAVVLHPLDVEDPDTLVTLYQTIRGPGETEFTGERSLAWDNFQLYRDQNRTLEDLALFLRIPMSLTGGDEPERVQGAFVTSNYFDLLGITPEHGRLLQPDDDAVEGAQPVVVLSHALWSRRFGADPAVIGRTAHLNGHALTVVGVAPPGFDGTEVHVNLDLWLPATMVPIVSPYAEFFHQRDAGLFQCFGRLAPGVSVSAAEDDLHTLSVVLSQDYLQNDEAMGIKILPLAETVVPSQNRAQLEGYGKTLILAVAVILLIACLNVSTLLWVRGLERRREIALRQALGAGGGRIVRQLMIESVLLFLLGGALSLPVAYGTLVMLWNFRPPQFDAGALDLGLQGVGILFSFAVAAACGLVFGLIPALRAARPDLTTSLQEGGLAGSPGRSFFGLRVHLRSLLVTVQLAFALVALLSAGLYLSSLAAVNDIDLGFDADHLAVVRISPGEQGMDEAQGRQLYRRVVERLEALPGVRSVALSENRLLRGAIVRNQLYTDGQLQALQSPQGPDHRTNIVSSGFFATVGIPLVAGEDFDKFGTEGGPPVMIVNDTLARTVWPGENPVGKTLHFNYPTDPPVTVIGVAADIRYRQLMEAPQFFLYLPLAQSYASAMIVHIRTGGDPAALLPSVRRALLELEPNLVFSDLATLRRFVNEAMWPQRAAVMVSGAFSVLALTLALVGVFGMVSFTVTQKRHELAVRRAFGARANAILGSVLGELAGFVGAGVLLGWVLGYSLLRPAIANQLYGVSAIDPWIYGRQALLLILAALAAALIPARRALSIDPMSVLRGE